MFSIETLPKTGIEKLKCIFIYFNGTFPKKAYPIKDTILASRLFPDATTFIIRCKGNQENVEYFNKYFPKTNKNGENISLKFVTENFSNWDGANKKTDAMFCMWLGFDGYQNIIGNFKMKFHMIMFQYKKPIYFFINEPSCSSFRDFRDYIMEKPERLSAFNLQYNEIKDRTDAYQNVNFMPNDTPFKKDRAWWDAKLKPIYTKLDIKVTPIPDNIIYDLPSAEFLIKKFVNKKNDGKKGVYIAAFGDDRVTHINKIFTKENLIDLKLLGRGSENLNCYSDKTRTDSNVPNSELPKLFSEHDWSIYFSRGKFVTMLGATFYEPLLNGLPLFVDVVADPNKEIFKDVDCYYSTQEELKELVDKTDLKKLWLTQVSILM